MTNLTWKIDNLERRTSDGFVTTAHWRANAVDGEFSASVYGSCGWGEGDPVIPFEDLTEETVLEWVWENGVDKEATEENLTNQIDALKNPASASGTPW
jgi:hypothetical protein